MRLIRNVYSGELGKLNLQDEKALGTAGILLKGGQGEWPDVPRTDPLIASKIEEAGFPTGVTWQYDARISPERHKAGIKTWYPTGDFGKLGLWLCLELPWYPMKDFMYWLFPYCNYKNFESVWRGVYNYTGVYPGIYTSVSKWNLVCGAYPQDNKRKMPDSLQEEMALRSKLLAAQYGVPKPDPFGAWAGKYTGWQWRENPDYSYFSDEWYEQCTGTAVPEPEPEPEPMPIEIKAITVHVRAQGKVELSWAKFDGGTDVTKITTIETEPFPEVPPTPEPEPQPNPDDVVDSIRYGVLRFQKIENELTTTGRYTPAVVQLQDRPVPNSGKGAAIPVHKSAWNFMRRINDDRGYKYCQSVGAMWINTKYTDPLQAHGESIDCQCNVVSWDEDTEKNGCYKIRSFLSTTNFDTIDHNQMNWHLHPELFIKAQSTILDGSMWIKVLNGVDCYIPLMARSVLDGGTGELWLSKLEVEPFLPLPCVVKVVADIGLNARKEPAIESPMNGSYLFDETMILLEYRPLGNTVWARTAKGWVCLRTVEGIFTTTWTLETPHVLPPA